MPYMEIRIYEPLDVLKQRPLGGGLVLWLGKIDSQIGRQDDGNGGASRWSTL